MKITESQIRRIIREELTKQEVRNMIDSQLSSYSNGRDLKKAIRNVAVDIIDEFFHEMWRKNGFWKSSLKNKG